jgi:exo-beta-1,3-glucanase (GH17 family)
LIPSFFLAIKVIQMKINKLFNFLIIALLLTSFISCDQGGNSTQEENTPKEVTAKEILGNPKYLAMSYGGYRENTRDAQPTIEQLKEDMKILSAMGVGIVRTYNVKLEQAANLLEAIHQLREADPTFEMYVMLGAWINCEGAWTDTPNHDAEDVEGNTAEIARAVALANKYPDIVKVIAVGNEAMVKWAATYFVQPGVILKWVNHLQELKKNAGLPAGTWITCSDNYAAWGGEGDEYHVEDLNKLIAAVDYVSLHIYPMHETHYKPDFWGVFDGEEDKTKEEKIALAMQRALDFGLAQYDRTVAYMKKIGVEKPIHIGETGWASSSDGFYGDNGTKATDEYKEGLFYNLIREWTAERNMACFYFEAFNENWKDEKNPNGSENFFGVFTIDGQAKYALWDLVDKGAFEGLERGGNTIGKTYDGDKAALLEAVKLPPTKTKK